MEAEGRDQERERTEDGPASEQERQLERTEDEAASDAERMEERTEELSDSIDEAQQKREAADEEMAIPGVTQSGDEIEEEPPAPAQEPPGDGN
jgi:hypothetical protein